MQLLKPAELEEKIFEIIGRNLPKGIDPFWLALFDGSLPIEGVRHWAKQLFFMTDGFGRFTSAIHSNCPVFDVRHVLAETVYEEHGQVLSAIADAAGHDSGVEATYRGLITRFVDASAARIELDVAAGRTDAADARETARALVWMSERYLNEALGRIPRTPVDIVVETLSTVWVRTLYDYAPDRARS